MKHTQSKDSPVLQEGQEVWLDGKLKCSVLYAEPGYTVLRLPNGAEQDFEGFSRIRLRSDAEVRKAREDEINRHAVRIVVSLAASAPGTFLLVGMGTWEAERERVTGLVGKARNGSDEWQAALAAVPRRWEFLSQAERWDWTAKATNALLDGRIATAERLLDMETAEPGFTDRWIRETFKERVAIAVPQG